MDMAYLDYHIAKPVTKSAMSVTSSLFSFALVYTQNCL